MRSKTSCFNSTVYKKDLTRYAPVWLLYALCLILGIIIMYTEARNASDNNHYWFPVYMGECIQFMAAVNLCYGLLTALLLFGDLCNTRMCYGLHALPLRRESWYLTHLAAGLTFSVLPTALMALVSLPLLAGTSIQNAWLISPLWFLASNLQYLCFFGIGVFSMICVGNRFAAIGIYCVVNFGSLLAYFFVDSLYTPMLYGVITPTRLSIALSPVYTLATGGYMEFTGYHEALIQSAYRPDQVRGEFWLTGCEDRWAAMAVYAAGGLAFLALGLVLYRKRRLETAGDVVSFPVLRPVFLVLAAVLGSVMAYLMAVLILDVTWLQYLCLVLGLALGWFAARMILERTMRVFRPRNWLGLAAAAAVLGLSLAVVRFDLLQIDERIPQTEDIQSVSIYGSGSGAAFTEEADIETVRRIHSLILEDRLEQSGAYLTDYDAFASQIYDERSTAETYGAQSYEPEILSCRYSSSVTLTYELNNGATMERQFFLWADQEEGQLLKTLLSDWDTIFCSSEEASAWGVNLYGLSLNTDRVSEVTVSRVDDKDMDPACTTPEAIEALLEAMKADCQANATAYSAFLHEGHFYYTGEFEEEMEYDAASRIDRSISISIWVKGGRDLSEDTQAQSSVTLPESSNEMTCYDINVYPEMTNTIDWLRSYNLFPWTVESETVYVMW